MDLIGLEIYKNFRVFRGKRKNVDQRRDELGV